MDRPAVYQTYRTDAEHPYVSGYVPEQYSDDSDSSSGGSSGRSQEVTVGNEPNIPGETQGLVNSPSYVDDDDQWHDHTEYNYSGIQDIIVTGTVRLEFSSWPLPMRSFLRTSTLDYMV